MVGSLPNVFPVGFARIFSAMRWLHDRYIAHCDISMENILVTKELDGRFQAGSLIEEFSSSRKEMVPSWSFMMGDFWGISEFFLMRKWEVGCAPQRPCLGLIYPNKDTSLEDSFASQDHLFYIRQQHQATSDTRYTFPTLMLPTLIHPTGPYWGGPNPSFWSKKSFTASNPIQIFCF